MRLLFRAILISSLIILTACSDAVLRTLDDYNVSMGGEPQCVKSADFKVQRYASYAYETGGLCNIWKGKIDNYSDYTIKCMNYIGGDSANSIYAAPREITEQKQIGYMSGGLSYECTEWAREPFVARDYDSDGYQLLMKMSSSVSYVALRNTGPISKICYIRDINESTISEEAVNPGGHSGWIELPSMEYYTFCEAS